MKKRAIMLLLLLLLTVVTSALGEHIGSMTVVNCEEWVSLRSQPDSGAKRLMKVPLGATVENCSRHSDTFIYCEYDGRGGYILAEYLEQAQARAQYLGDLRVVNCKDWVNMRAKPDTDAKRIAKVPFGATIRDCTAAENGFVFGRYEDREGYISAAYLQSAEGAAATDQLTDCRIQMVNDQRICGAALIGVDLGGVWSLEREKDRLDAVCASLADGWREMVQTIPPDRIVEISAGQELYLIIPADEAASVTIIELESGTANARGAFRRVAYNSQRGEPVLLRCNAAASAPGEAPVFDCEVNVVDSRGRGLTWYPCMDPDAMTMQTQGAGGAVFDFTDESAE